MLKIKDPNFYHHNGVDFVTPGTGVTTISQGLVKMYYFENFEAGLQKIEQTLIARFAFDPLIRKDTILKLFINEVYLGEEAGEPLKGFADASKYYFGKNNFKQLSQHEYLSLISMIRAPFRFHYLKNREKNLERVKKSRKYYRAHIYPLIIAIYIMTESKTLNVTNAQQFLKASSPLFVCCGLNFLR